MKKKCLLVYMFLICFISSALLPVKVVQASPDISHFEDMDILSKNEITLKDMQDWARKANATETFINLAPMYVKLAPIHGNVNPVIAYAQAAKETAYGRFTGVLNEAFFNPCGIKIAQGGDDKDPLAHSKFNSWEEGVSAHLDHLALYAGAASYPKKHTFDPRHFEIIRGKATLIKDLGGKWAPSESYGLEVAALVKEISKGTKSLEPKVIKPEVVKDIKPAVPEVIKPEVAKDVKPAVPEVIKPEVVKDIKPAVPEAIKPEAAKDIKPAVPEAIKPAVAQVVTKINSVTIDGTKYNANKSKVNTTDFGRKVEISVDATGNGNFYEFWISDGSTWTPIAPGSAKPSVSWTPKEKGYHDIWVGIKESSASKEYIANFNTFYYIDNIVTKVNSVTIDGTKYNANKSKVNTTDFGRKVEISVDATGNGNFYEFWISDGSTWTPIEPGSAKPSVSWTPKEKGYHDIWVGIKESSASKEYIANFNTFYYIDNIVTKVNSVTIDGTKYNANKSKVNTTDFGRKVEISVDATGNGNFYEFWISDGSTWTPIAPGSAKPSVSWTPKEKGYHDIWVGIKESSASKEYIENFNTFYYIDNIVTKVNSVTIDGTKYNANKSKVNTTDFGRKVEISVDATGNGNFYEFWISDGSTWTPIAPGSARPSVSWTPKEKGYHDIWVGIKESSASKEYIANFNTFYYIDNIVTKINSVTIDGTKYSANKSKVNTNDFGRPVEISVDATGNGNFYEFWISDGSTWTLIAPGSAKPSVSWTPKEKGYHDIWVGIKESSASKEYIANFNTFYYIDNIYNVATKINSVTIDGTKYNANKSKVNTNDFGRPVEISVDATGNGNFYEFWISDGSTWTLIAPGSAKANASWTPKEKGYHDIWVGIKESGASKEYIANFNTFYYIDNIVTKVNSVTIDGTKYNANKSKVNTEHFGKAVEISVDATGNGNFYEFWISDGSTWTPITPGSTKPNASWTPKEKGYHDIWVGIKESSASKEYIANFNTFYYISQPSVITKRLIVLDPGHNYGGDDGAYSNIDGVRYSERDLNMEISLKVKANLEKLGFKVILTRQPEDRSKDSLSDSLKMRTKIANDAKTDFFLSLHHDSGAPAATGISTHYSSFRPTIDNEGVTPGVDPGGWKYDDLKIDTTPSAQAIVSRELANNLVNGLSSSFGYINRKAHDHGLYVTRQIDVPSVLLELGFITNKAEVERCSNDYEQEKKAKKIAEILYNYFNR
ncbi:N-acetylmuramoyl-L-alanine amidase [Clostridium putrefaciens]|uniref:N-acetylmuramoyl-L-alanine amidase n=1 Tax=Clostridium putrefaciens TaxID=99675 RepID=A0A381J6V0_9CLOT|nr:N-acetylmuramoyl-L-alanine amidase [Clostridium putrefaciens]SUY45666.1 N-acetylmuramoyl-L-alanine amidase [Clostridium putrefaciens]